jgi:hypothetical protein
VRTTHDHRNACPNGTGLRGSLVVAAARRRATATGYWLAGFRHAWSADLRPLELRDDHLAKTGRPQQHCGSTH